jgi:hypothetical protein
LTVRDRIADGIKQGKTLEQIIGTDPTKEFKSVFDRKDFVKSVYDSLRK